MTIDYETLIEPLKSRRTFEDVSDKLKELIFNGTIKPGQKLPSENALAQLFQVGRQSVREALRVLELSGFITVRPGVKGGSVIEATMLSKMAGLFLDAFKFNRISVDDCLMARRAIEASVLELSLKNADQSDIESLRNNIARARAKLLTNNPAYEENIEFHRILAAASKNYTFSIVMESILTVLSDFRSRLNLVSTERSARVVEIHEAIVDAIVAKKKRDAVALLDKDLMVVAEIILGRSDELPLDRFK
jgi:GntR family transcriptional repressor for pyruvate dehydrogenase complex